MNLFSRPLSLIFKSLLVVTAVFSFCAEGDWDWFSGTSSFAPEAFITDKSYEPLFYSNHLFYSSMYDWGGDYDSGFSDRFEKTIIADWKKYLGNKIPETDLKYYIFSDSARADLAAINKAITTKDGKSKWNKKHPLSDQQVRQFFLFLKLAKAVEPYCTQSPSWNYETERLEEVEQMPLKQAKAIESVYQAVKDPFLKSRYWFLAMKSYFYSENRTESATFFNRTQATVAKEELYYRALSYVAGVAFKAKKFATSNYLYAVVFDHCPHLRSTATFCFHPQDESDFQEALLLCKNDSQKAALWTLYGYYADELSAIQNIHQLEPTNPHLDLLLTRAINKAEDKMNSNSDDYSQGTTFKAEALSPKLSALVGEIAKANNTKNPHVWNLAYGFLQTINGNYTSAAHYYTLAEKSLPAVPLAKQQLKLFKVFNEIAALKKMDEAAQKKILPHLKWLYKLSQESEENNNLRTSFLISWSKTYLGNLYKKQGNIVYSELLYNNPGFYLNATHLEKMQAYQESAPTAEWDRFLLSLYNIKLDDIYEYKAIKLAYANNISGAVEEMEKAVTRKDTTLYGNPFNGNIRDCSDCDHEARQVTKYTKISFLHKMNEIQGIIERGDGAFTDYLLLGNAFYNMSFYGNARLFYDNKIIDQYYTNYINDTYKGMLVNDQQAGLYYQKALAAAENDEQGAKAVYMLTKIERNAFYQTPAFKPYQVDFVFFKGFKILKNKYKQTKYYQDVINECGYFRAYAN
ncbi:hypothetical protein V3470_01860 [Flavobacterium oreochromis]|uniref:Tetratricopeptide repeat protein n=1 Tax=Flavobacterium oreochromis TaxID=2906078 RepID=A0ABW8P572_9FLAO|nr:hypothetical protein [Flavobacterium oreochromis]OWP76353.1 hypothetical protein BWG23_08310 [Flavobacterium oreochromis]